MKISIVGWVKAEKAAFKYPERIRLNPEEGGLLTGVERGGMEVGSGKDQRGSWKYRCISLRCPGIPLPMLTSQK